jgi:perosamine synthetase
MLKIPFFKVNLTDSEVDAVSAVLRSGWLTTGPKTREFESDFSRYMGQVHSVAVNSCTAALHLALEAIGIKNGDGVLVPTMTFAASAEVIRYFDARPLMIDCREDDFGIDIAHAELVLHRAKAAGQKVSAIIAVHYGGQICDVVAIRRLAKRHDLRVIEDAAHCCPAYFRESDEMPWKMVGAGADVCCHSFYANKTITTGEGGMACTSQDALADRMRIMSLHGISKDAWNRFTSEGSWYYEITAPGFKYNLTDIASALGVEQLRKADQFWQMRTKVAECYSQMLADVDEIILPTVRPNRIHSWHLYVIRLRLDRLAIDRAAFIKHLKDAGIGCSVHWMPLHLHPYYREKYGYRPEDFPVATRLYEEIISLPIYPALTEEDVAYVSGEIKRIVANHHRSQ